MPVSDRMVLLVRAVSVFAVNAFLGLVVSAITYGATAHGLHGAGGHATAAAVAITVAWLLPMTAVCALTLAVAVIARSASAGASRRGARLGGHGVRQQARPAAHFTAAVTDTHLPAVPGRRRLRDGRHRLRHPDPKEGPSEY